MRNVYLVVLYSLLTLGLVAPSAADGDPSAVFSIELPKSSDQVKAQFLTDQDQVYSIRPESLNLAKAGTLSLPLPNGEVWTATRKDSYDDESGRVWTGQVSAFAGGPQGRMLLIAQDDGTMLGEFSLAGEQYLIWPDPQSGSHELIRKAPQAFPSCGGDSHDSHGQDETPHDLHHPQAAKTPLSTPEWVLNDDTDTAKVLDSKNGRTILDVLPLYDSSLRLTDVNNQLTLWRVQANDVFKANGIGAEYAYPSSPIAINASILPNSDCLEGLRSNLQWLSDTPDQAQALRNEFGADFVTLMVPASVQACPTSTSGFPQDACGVANRPLRDGFGRKNLVNTFWGQRAMSAIRLGCGMADYTFAHELGHNYGAFHDENGRPSAPYAPVQPGAFGYFFTDQGEDKATIMACAFTGNNDIYNQNICNRVPNFSSPDVTLPQGVVIGDADHNNRSLVANSIASYSKFREQGGPTVRILAPARNSAVDLFNNRFEATARGAGFVKGAAAGEVQVDLSDRIQWKIRTLRPDRNRDIVKVQMGQGRAIENFDFSSLIGQVPDDTQFELIASVTDSAGRVARWRVPIEVDLRPPTATFTQSCQGLQCTFDASASTALEGPVTYSWSFSAFGCSNSPDCFSSSQSGSPTLETFFLRYGGYRVSLTVRDAYGQTATAHGIVGLTPPASSFSAAGSWYNPDRSGHGIDLYRNSQNNYVAIWYTYEEFTKKPTWYLSGAAPIVNNRWSVPLSKVTRNSAGQVTTEQIGRIWMDFSDSQNAGFRWDFTLNGRNATGAERFQVLFRGNTSRTGFWHDPNEGGWGLMVHEKSARNPNTNQLELSDLVSLAFIDPAGRARWVSGLRTQTLSQNVTVPMRYVEGENLCPFSSCFDGAPSTSMTAAGNVTINMPFNGSPGPASTNVVLPGGVTWVRGTTMHRLAGR